MEVPYTSTPRSDTGLFNAKLGIWLFLSSEVMLFGALFSSYVLLRVGAETWPHGYDLLEVPLGTINTIVLITSSVTMVMSWASLKLKEFKKFRRYLGTTILLAFVFLVIKGFEYGSKFEHHLFPGTNDFLAIYFTLTGLHGLHVIAGILVNSYMFFTSKRWWQADPERFTNRIEIAGLYWHFVDIVWIFLFPTLYLL